MAPATTSGPQQQVAMPAVDFRRFFGSFVGFEGVSQVNDLAVSQRGAGANLSVDVAAGTAVIKDDHVGGGGYYHASWTTVENVTVTTPNASNPRVDRIVVRVRDASLGDAVNDIGLFVVTGTATAGATLTNLNGAAAVPGSSLLIANVLVGAAATSIVTANIDTATATVRRVLAPSWFSTDAQLYRPSGATMLLSTVGIQASVLAARHGGDISISSGVISVTAGFHRLTTPSGLITTINSATGIETGPYAHSGMILYLVNESGGAVTFNESSNIRTTTGSTVTLNTSRVAHLVYNGPSSKWQIVSIA